MQHESEVDRETQEQLRISGADHAIGKLAGRQHGVVARRQLLALGLGRSAIDHRVMRGRLCGVHRGVYAVGHRVLSKEGVWMAAVLAEGPGAVLSHFSAAALWTIRSPAGDVVHVTEERSGCSRRGIRLHQCSLPADEVTITSGIPVTTVPRTLSTSPPPARRAKPSGRSRKPRSSGSSTPCPFAS